MNPKRSPYSRPCAGDAARGRTGARLRRLEFAGSSLRTSRMSLRLDFGWRPRQIAATNKIMNYRPLGNSGISASIVGLGAWVLGGGQLWGQDPDDAESIRAI